MNGRNAISWEDKFKHDVWYVDNWSLWLDLKIIAMTVWKILKREGISQPGQATAEEFNPQITQIDADYKKKEKRYKARVVGGSVAEDLFDRGLCLPSGTAMTEGDLDRVIETIVKRVWIN